MPGSTASYALGADGDSNSLMYVHSRVHKVQNLPLPSAPRFFECSYILFVYWK